MSLPSSRSRDGLLSKLKENRKLLPQPIKCYLSDLPFALFPHGRRPPATVFPARPGRSRPRLPPSSRSLLWGASWEGLFLILTAPQPLPLHVSHSFTALRHLPSNLYLFIVRVPPKINLCEERDVWTLPPLAHDLEHDINSVTGSHHTH